MVDCQTCQYGQFWVRKRSFFGFEWEWKKSKIFCSISKLATQWLFPMTWDPIRLHETSHRPPSFKSFYKLNFEKWKMNFLVTKILHDDSSNIFLQFWKHRLNSKCFSNLLLTKSVIVCNIKKYFTKSIDGVKNFWNGVKN